MHKQDFANEMLPASLISKVAVNYHFKTLS